MNTSLGLNCIHQNCMKVDGDCKNFEGPMTMNCPKGKCFKVEGN